MIKVALITGGSRGIGYGIAQCLAKEGLDLVICGMRHEDEVSDAIQSLRELGGEVLYCRADISDAAMRQSMLDEVKKQYGRLNILINNAGVAPLERSDQLSATEESFERVMRINLQGPHFLCQSAANWMIGQKKTEPGFSGCIVNITSVSAALASTNRAEYCISKAGLSMSTKTWAVRLAEYDIPVFEVRPGIIKTDMTAPQKVTAKYDKMIKEGLLLQPRWGTPADVGKAVAMLVRGDLPYAAGQVITIDGGMMIERL